MEKAKTTTETVSATIKENEKTIVYETTVELNTEEYSPKHKVLHGSFRLSPDTLLLPSLYQLLLKDGRSYQIVVKGIHQSGRVQKRLVRFLVVPED